MRSAAGIQRHRSAPRRAAMSSMHYRPEQTLRTSVQPLLLMMMMTDEGEMQSAEYQCIHQRRDTQMSLPPTIPLASPAMGQWGTCPHSTYNSLFFQYTLTFTKSDSNYMSTVASCKNPATFACAPPGTKS